jgi:hypothetical protein
MDVKTREHEDAADALAALKFAAESALPAVKIEKAISRLPVSADSKALIMNISQVTVRVGREVLRVGRLVVSFAIDLAKRYPNTAFAVIIGLVMTGLISLIPWIGPFLAAFLGPILLIAGIAWGAANDLREASLRKRLELLEKVGEADRNGLLERLAILEGQFRAAEAVVVEQGGATHEP